MTGRVRFTPEASHHLDDLDEWITEQASAEAARTFISAVMDHCDGISTFPYAGRSRDDVRPGMRTTTYRKRTTVAYEVVESTGEFVVNILGIFHGGQDWEAAVRPDGAR